MLLESICKIENNKLTWAQAYLFFYFFPHSSYFVVCGIRVKHFYREHFQLLYLLTTSLRAVIIPVCLYANAWCGMQTASSWILNITGSHMAIFKGGCPWDLWSILLYDALVVCNVNALDCGKFYVHQKSSRIKAKQIKVGCLVAGLFVHVDHIITFCQPTASRRHMPAVS